MPVQVYIGVDPGQSGAIVWLRPTLGDIQIDPLRGLTPADILAVLLAHAPEGCFAYIERVHSMPKQGVVSTFKFGLHYGLLQMALVAARIPYEFVTPHKWQRGLGCLSRGDKNVTKRKAQDLFPGVKVTHATADALLIAEYCRRKHKGIL